MDFSPTRSRPTTAAPGGCPGGGFRLRERQARGLGAEGRAPGVGNGLDELRRRAQPPPTRIRVFWSVGVATPLKLDQVF